MRGFLLAIDNGSQSTKVSVVDASGVVHASAAHRLRAYEHPAAGQVVHPDDDVWASIVHACRAALAAWSGDVRQIVGVGLCTTRFCRTLLDEQCRLAEPMVSWMDARVSGPHDGLNPKVRYLTTSSGYITHRLKEQRRDTAANY